MSEWSIAPKTKQCKRGHVRTPESTYVLPNGTFTCRPFKSLSLMKYQKSHKAVFGRVNKRAQDKDGFGGNRESVIKLDGEKCRECGMTRDEHKALWGRDITVDHIDGLGRYVSRDSRNNSIDNLQTLCLRCHGRKDTVRRGSNLVRSTT